MTTTSKPFLIKDDLVIDNAVGRQFVIPSGGDSTRPGAIGTNTPAPREGTLRLNNDRGVVEVFNGSEWQSAASAGDAVNATIAEEIALVQSIIYG
jgi:hypothetical protein